MPRSGPPAYAWDWFARQRLLWREVRARLSRGSGPVAARYAAVQDRAEVLPLLRADYPREESVRRTMEAVIAETAFLGRTDASFASLGLRSAPRGLRWWWTALTGEELDGPRQERGAPTAEQLSMIDPVTMQRQPTLDDVAEGYGDHH
ncbi:MAG: hypothetical protein WD638_07375 [Nitriliruptoraceae bacterium]